MIGPTTPAASSLSSFWRILSTLLATTTTSSTFDINNTAGSSSSSSSDAAGAAAVITGLYRYAVKGLSSDSLESVFIANSYDTFPDDRRFALLLHDVDEKEESNKMLFDESNPQWLHKENFLCTFTDPKLMAQYEASYQIVLTDNNRNNQQLEQQEQSIYTYGLPNDKVVCIGDDDDDDDENTNEGSIISSPSKVRRLLSLRERTRRIKQTEEEEQQQQQGKVAIEEWGPYDLNTKKGRKELGDFFSKKSGRSVQCVTAKTTTTAAPQQPEQQQQQQKHQFGNTSCGWKQRNKDTRTIHLINANTVRQVAEKCNMDVSLLRPTRFRPNIVVDGWEPWKEFEWIGKTLEILPSSTTTDDDDNNNNKRKPMRLSILSKTVRCDGVSVDPLDYDPSNDVLDIPKLLAQNFPEHGPYLGVYAVIDDPGLISLGDTIRLSPSSSSSSTSL